MAAVDRAISDIFDEGERRARAALAAMPKGTFRARDEVEDGGMGTGPTPVEVEITITDERFTIDFSGTGPQARGSINCTRVALMAGMRIMFMALATPQVSANDGVFRPLEVICPDGTIFTAQRPAPTSTYWETRLVAGDVVWQALAKALPERLTAGQYLSVCSQVLRTRHPASGELALLVEPNAGAPAAGSDKDGESGLFCMSNGKTYVLSAEVAETRYDVEVERYGFDVVPGGEGRHRGGRGLERSYRMRSEGSVTASFGRSVKGAWAVAGGHAQLRRGAFRRWPPAGQGGQGDPGTARAWRPGAARHRHRRRLGRPTRTAPGAGTLGPACGPDLQRRRRESVRPERVGTVIDYSARRRRLQAAIQKAGIGLLAVGPGEHMTYLLGFHTHPDERPSLFLLTPEREGFLMPALNAEDSRQHTDMPFEVWADDTGPDAALERLSQQLDFSQVRRVALDETMRTDFSLLLLKRLNDAATSLADEVLSPLRMRKEPAEIDLIQMNADIGDAAMRAAYAAVRPGVSEQQVAHAVHGAFDDAEVDQVNFAIIGSGPNGAFPHHATGKRVLQEGDAVVIDIGARKDHYNSDITRMVHVGEPSADYLEVHEIVEVAVAAALAVVRPGVRARDIDGAARGVIAAAGYGEFFVHRTGHGLGLTVHEPPYITASNDFVLEEGMVFSIEPGIYLPGRFGVRLEEIVTVTDRGVQVFSRLPRNLHVAHT